MEGPGQTNGVPAPERSVLGEERGVQLGRHSLYPMDGRSKLPSEDEAVNALLQAGDVHDLHKVPLHSPKLLGIAHTLVLGVLALQPNISHVTHDCQAAECCEP